MSALLEIPSLVGVRGQTKTKLHRRFPNSRSHPISACTTVPLPASCSLLSLQQQVALRRWRTHLPTLPRTGGPNRPSSRRCRPSPRLRSPRSEPSAHSTRLKCRPHPSCPRPDDTCARTSRRSSTTTSPARSSGSSSSTSASCSSSSVGASGQTRSASSRTVRPSLLGLSRHLRPSLES